MEFHKLDVKETLNYLNTSLAGLTNKEAENRLNKYGLNEIKKQKKKNYFLLFLTKLFDYMSFILLLAALISYFLHEYSDFVIILVVVFLNASISFFQETKAAKEIEKLSKLAAPKFLTRRENKLLDVEVSNLTIGDIVYLKEGDVVGFDGRVLEAYNLKVNESSLSGESLNTYKTSEVTYDNDKEATYQNMVFASSLITYGHGKVCVTNIGEDTQIGKIATSLKKEKESPTPLQLELKSLAKKLTIFVIIVMLLIFLISLIFKNPLLEALLLSISLGVAAIPEGLVAIVTISLAIGVNKLTKKNVLVRKLASVETLGASDVICTDKTGTLSENTLEVETLFLNLTSLETKNQNISNDKMLFMILGLCNSLTFDSNKINGDPLEKALYRFSLKHNYSKDYLLKYFSFVLEKPFDSTKKFMSVIYKDQKNYYLLTKGAPEVILNSSSYYYSNNLIKPLTSKIKEDILKQNKNYASNGRRVIAMAFKVSDNLISNEEKLVFHSLVSLVDPLKKGVKESIKVCKEAGIKIIMITGDQKETAFSIAKSLKIASKEEEMLSGKELDSLSNEALKKKINSLSVYYRISPLSKAKIIEVLKSKGKVVAMSGDGVNDALSLKKADIGIAMGEKGSEVSKEAASLILKDDNFTTIVMAIKEGRRIYSNIKKSIIYLLSCNLGEVFLILISTILNIKILLPIHILYMNLITDTMPSIMLANEKEEVDIMKEKPRNKKDSLLNLTSIFMISYQGIFQGLITLLSFFIGKSLFNIQTGETMAFVTIIYIQLFHSLNSRSLTKSIFKLKHNISLYVVVSISLLMQIIIINTSLFNKLFKVSKLPFGLWMIAILLALLIIPLVELCKMFAKEIKSDH